MPRKMKGYTIDSVPAGFKMIEIYGSYVKEVNKLERVLKTRKDGVKQHYWVKTGERERKAFSGRIGFFGSGYDLAGAVMKTDHIVPRKNFQVIPAREYNDDPWKFGTTGEWVVKNVESR